MCCPPGPLGVIFFDSAHGPIVAQVRESSPLVNEVWKGDYVLTLDGEDARKLTADDLATLLRARSDRQRTLTVAAQTTRC